jgi:hypothetical protein
VLRFYRAVSPEELADISLQGGFRPVRTSLEGKWFAETIDACRQWGQQLYQGKFHVIQVDVPTDVADQMFCLSSLDQIGPARYAESEVLALINQNHQGISEVPQSDFGRSIMATSFAVIMRWLTPEEGGRMTPFEGHRYTPTARFIGEDSQFSVVVEFSQKHGGNPARASLRLLLPDRPEVEERIRGGAALEIMEGSRVVACCALDIPAVSAISAAVASIGAKDAATNR